jgi:hypothetical protein
MARSTVPLFHKTQTQIAKTARKKKTRGGRRMSRRTRRGQARPESEDLQVYAEMVELSRWLLTLKEAEPTTVLAPLSHETAQRARALAATWWTNQPQDPDSPTPELLTQARFRAARWAARRAPLPPRLRELAGMLSERGRPDIMRTLATVWLGEMGEDVMNGLASEYLTALRRLVRADNSDRWTLPKQG